jgi:sugar lactone lactonase YvrE
MNNIYFFKKRKTSHSSLKKTLMHSVSQKLLLMSFLVLSIFSMKSQTAPNVSYATPQNYLLNSAITTLAPVNSGGSVPALNYKQVSIFAGTTAGFLDGAGTSARMDGPLGMTMDASGNVYFVDSANFRIRKMTPAGEVTTIAGDGYSLFFYGRLRNNAVGSAASFSWPSGIVLDTTNNCLYVTDKENDVIRKVSLTGTFAVTTFAGSGTSSSLDGTGTDATFKKPNGIAIDATNKYLYVSDRTGNKIRRITISNAQVLTIAGNGTASTVDNATGTLATFNDPTGIAVDANFIYVSDFGGNKIRKIALAAPYAVTTFAGSGATSSVDDTGVSATFNTPFGIALDGGGNLFITEWGNKIRKITPTGIVTTIAGSGAASSVDGNGTAATFNDPANLVINPTTGVGYVSEWTGDRIRKIELGGYAVSPVLPAGLSLNSSTGSITGTPTTINNGPLNYSISAYNYYGSSTATLAITTGTIPTLTTTVASALTQTTATTGGNVTTNGGSTLLEKGICWSTSANPTILDTKVVNGTTTTGSYTAAIAGLVASTTYYIRAYATNVFGTSYGTQVSFTTLITPPTISYTASNTFTVNAPITTLTVSNTGGTVSGLASTNVSTFAGSTVGYTNDSGTAAKFYNPIHVASDVLGTIYVSDSNNYAIRKITPAGLVSLLAGGNGIGTTDGTGSSVKFYSPNGIATDMLGNVFVADGGGIRKINASGNVTTLLSNQNSSIPVGTPKGIVVDTSGIIYFSDTKNRIYKIDTSNNLTVLAGGDNISGTDDGIGTSARFNFLNGLAVDATGNVYVADSGNNRIRKITPSGVVTTLAGSTSGFNDGIGASAQFKNPFGITVDASGTLYVAENNNNRIRKITSTGVVTTIAGIASTGSMDGNASLASFTSPTGITSDSDGNLYVADYGNHKIRKIATSNGFSILPALPAGLVLNADGSITGTPTMATAATTYTVRATNAGGLSSFEISIATLALPVITTTAARSITATALTTGGRVTSAAASVTAAGMCYSTSPLPTLLDTFTTDVLNEGSFTRTIGNLTALTTYYIRAYATNSVGTSYGNQIVVNTPMYAPIISYYSPIPFIVNTPITALEVSNSGGAIPTQLYGVSTVAGGNVPGSADGALGTALFSNPTAVVKDSQGNLFVADYFNHGIRKIAPNGIVSFYAGGSGPGSADGPRANSSFKNPFGLAIDHLDNLYVSEPLAHTIRKITASGIVSTFAGTYGVPNSDNLSFNSPRGLTCDAAGNVYVIDAGNSRIQKITPNGIMSIIFVGGDVGVSYNMVFDSVGNLWLATESTQGGLKKINTNGVVTSTLFGRTTKSIAIDQSDNIYIADQLGAVRKITPSIAISEITSGGIGFADGEFAVAKFNGISGLYLDQEGLLYVADTDNNRVRVITPFGYSVTPALPAGLVLNTDGSITGTPTVATAATNYTITGINSGGNSSTALNFAIATFPTLTTTAASAVIATSATAGGNVTSDGYTSVTERGVCWSTTSNPTIADAKTTNGTETGTFTSSITGLSPVTTYYIRAYATNSVGTVYGNEIVVNTPMYAPVISYSSPNAFVVDNPITALEVSNSGGATTSTIDGDTPAVVSTLAGICGTSGATNGQGTAASFNSPNAVAVDANNNVYVSDLSNRKIRKITATGIVSDFATVTSPQGIAVDTNGNVYVSTGTNEIRKYIQNGTFTILAAGTNFTSAKGLAVDTNGNVYVADRGVSKIMKISPSGVISTLAGSGEWGSADGLAANATFFTPIAVAVDASGTVYVTDYDNPRIRKITNDGIVSTLAGSSTWGFQNGTGSQARFSYLEGIAVDTFGNVYVADSDNYAIRKITPQGVVTTLTGFSEGSCTDGSLNQAKFASPKGLTIDASGNLYVSDAISNTIRKITLNPYSVAPALPKGLTLNANGSITGTPTVATAAKDYVVTATNSGGSSSNTLNFAITTIPSLTTTEASAITAITATLGGNVTSDGYASVTARGICWSTSPNPTTAGAKTTNGTGTGIFESAITGLSPVTAYYVRAYATNSVGTVYGNEFSFTTVLPLPIIQYSAAVTYAVNTAITPLAVSNTGGVVINSLAGVSTFAGSTAGYTDGTTNAQFSQPSGVVTDSNGNLFVADSSNNAIRKITPSGTVSTFAGGTSGTADGQGSAAQFFRPNSIAIDANDNLYISDTGNHSIRKITPSGLVSTLAGTAGTAGFIDGTGTSAQFNTPYGLTLDVFGNVYVADNANNRIRKITPAGVVTTYFVVDYMLRTLDSPTAVAFDSSGNLFVSQASSNGLVKILITSSSELTMVDNRGPIGTITFDTNNTLYAAAGGAIIKAQEPYTSGTLFAGGSQGFADGALLEAKFGGIRGLTIDNEGVMYVADGVNNRIRKISPFGYLVSPALPAGLILNADGSITGTPTIATAATDYVVTATNSGGSSSYTLNFAIATIPTLTTTAASTVIATSATAGGTITNDGGASVTARGVCWSTISNPTISDSKTTDGTGIGIFESSITGLSPLSTYNVRAYATNSAGTAYGNEISFTTFALPVVVTRGPTTTGFPVITYTSAQCGGSIQSVGGSTQITKGIYYSESSTPTSINTISTIQTSGSIPLLYDTLLSNLKPNTTYYVRAFVSNEAGTGLGEIVSFTTKPLLFTTTGMNESHFGEGYTKNVAGGNINNINVYSNLYFEPTAYGVCWSTNANSNPTITDASTIIGATTDEFLESGQSFLYFERQLTGLTPNTTYYARSFAKNATEVTYGTLYSFDSYIGKPILTSTSTNVTSCSADLGGLISDASGGVMGIKGVVYSTNQQTVINATSANSGIGGVSSITSTGIGAFSLNKSNLVPNTTYYYKAYAFGSAPSIENIKLGWGDVKSFTTLAAAIPTITLSTVSVSNNGTITASSLGSSSSCGGAISEGGFCYSTSINPTVLNDKISLYATEYSLNNFLTGANLFLEITNYNPSQTYYVRSYAINTAGIAYSNNWILAIVAPSNLTVSQSIVSGTVGVTMSSITVSNSGGVATSYSISPSLPNGLLFDTLSGTISGTPVALLGQTTFTITATNSAGNTSTTLSLTINNSAPTSLISSPTSLSAALGTMIIPITMSNSGGIVASYSISPLLPDGLTLNATTGTISGTPTVLLSLTIYTITAMNNEGSTSTSISISVKDEKVWTGTISTAWNNAANWSNNTVPTSTDNVIINTSSPNGPTLNVAFTLGLGKTLTIGNTGTLIVAPNASLTIAGAADFGSKSVTFKSDATGTGVLGTITGTLTNADNVSTERYIAANRAFRFLTSSVTTTSSIKANWQEGANNTSTLYADNQNPNPTFGTHITGSTSGSNGFDATQSTNASLFGFDNATGQWTTIANTDTNLLSAGSAYRLMVRGDRSIDMSTNTPTPTPTTLRALGTLFTGSKTLSGAALNQVANGYSLIGNPYQAPVDLNTILGTATGLATQYCYVWEPRQNTRGAYVSVGVQTGVNSIAGSFATKYLQPGQAAFIRKDATTNAASLTFSEADKYLTTNESVFRQETSNLSVLKVSMHSNGTSLDGLAIVFDPNSNNGIDANDAGKLANLDEDLATSNNGSLSSIESRQFPVNNEEIQLYATKFRATNYTLKTTLENYSGPTPYLLDTYTQNYTEIAANAETVYPFSVASTIPNSIATNRFKIVFGNTVLGTLDFEKGCYLYPNPSADSAFYVHLNELNSSTKVTLFNTLGQQIQISVNATENNTYFCSTTSKLPTGAYFVVIEHNGKKTTKKWMVQ